MARFWLLWALPFGIHFAAKVYLKFMGGGRRGGGGADLGPFDVWLFKGRPGDAGKRGVFFFGAPLFFYFFASAKPLFFLPWDLPKKKNFSKTIVFSQNFYWKRFFFPTLLLGGGGKKRLRKNFFCWLGKGGGLSNVFFLPGSQFLDPHVPHFFLGGKKGWGGGAKFPKLTRRFLEKGTIWAEERKRFPFFLVFSRLFLEL